MWVNVQSRSSRDVMRCVAACLVACCLTGWLGASASADEDRRLLEAAKRRDLAAVTALINQKVDVNVAQLDGATALHWAAHWNDPEMVVQLLRAGAQVNAANDFGITPLMLAAVNGDAVTMDLLLNAGANPNASSPLGETVLMTAARTGDAASVRALLRRGVRLNVKETSTGQTALMWAISEGHLEVARALVEYGADVSERSTRGFTPLMFAAREGNLEIGRFLVDHGTDVNETSAGNASPLLIATVRGHLAFARFLLERGADPNAAPLGYTALHWAAGRWETMITKQYELESGPWVALGGVPATIRLDFISLLLGFGADVNARLTKAPLRFGQSFSAGRASLEGATPLLIAAMSADTAVMALLLDHGADPILTTTKRATLLHAAAGKFRTGADSRITDAQTIEAVKLAMTLGHRVDVTDDDGETALHQAAWLGTDAVVRFLFEQGANLDARNRSGQTPLGMATARTTSLMLLENKETAALLRRLGATDMGRVSVPTSGQ